MEQNIEKGEQRLVSLSQLYLDPNNYRFIDNENYSAVSADLIVNDRIQKRTNNFIQGKGTEGIRDLLKSFRANGFLHVDQIQVEEIGRDIYRVLEGNRRVTALRYLKEQYDDGLDLGRLDYKIFDQVPVVVYQSESQVSHQIIMGLKHINSNKKWPPLNQAQLLSDLINKQGMNPDVVSDSLGIGKVKIRKSLRALSLIEMYKKSDCGDQFETKMYAVFEEAVNKPNIRQWLSWDYEDGADKPTDKEKLDRFFSWLSTVEVEESVDPEDDQFYEEELEPIITKSAEIRDLAEFILDAQSVMTMEKYRSVSQALLLSDVVGKNKLSDSISVIDSQISIAKRFAIHASDDDLESLSNARKGIDAILEHRGMAVVKSESLIERQILISYKNSHFGRIHFSKYKKFSDFTLDSLSQINVIAGKNNSGKTSILEAIHLLTKQNDIFSFMETVRRRNKLKELRPAWFSEYVVELEMKLECEFDNKQSSLEIFSEIEDSEDLDMSNYLRSVFIETTFHGEASDCRYVVNQDKDGQAHFRKLNILCSSKFSSPYSRQNQKDIAAVYEKTIEENSLNEIVSFIRENIDSGVKDINYVGDTEYGRFLVDHGAFDEAVELTEFGEGLQRVFYIGLHFAACKYGVLLIDEFDNAIHHSLMIKFTEFAQKLASKFDTQLFVTTHSKECIESFVNNDFENNQVSFYSLREKDGKADVVHFEGEKYESLIDIIETELR